MYIQHQGSHCILKLRVHLVLFLIFVPSILQDGSRSLGLFRKGKICIIAKFYRTDLVICSHFRGGGGGGGAGDPVL